MFLYETHCHCSDCSFCARNSAREMVRAYHALGYAGLVMTDHFITGNTAVDRSLPWETQMRCYYKAFEDACDEAKDLDFDVIFGIEHAYGDGKEVLVYGIDLEFLLANPDLAEIPLAEFVSRVHEAGGIVVHAHPFRQRSYIDMDVQPRFDLVDGIEVYNAGDRAEDGDRLALTAARLTGHLMTSGSDFHRVNSVNFGKAGVYFTHRVRNAKEFVSALHEGVCGFFVDGKMVNEIREEDLP